MIQDLASERDSSCLIAVKRQQRRYNDLWPDDRSLVEEERETKAERKRRSVQRRKLLSGRQARN